MSDIQKPKEAGSNHEKSDIYFIASAIIILFAIVFLLTETGLAAIIFATVVFILFLKEGIDKEMSAAGPLH
jgi:cell division protein FtsW (lipid II flippase)